MDDLSVGQIMEKIERSAQRKLAVMNYPPGRRLQKSF